MADELYSSDEDVLESLQNIRKKSSSIHDLKHQEAFFKPFSTFVEMTPAEILLMSLKYVLNHNLSFTAMTDLFKLINPICGQTILPETRYMINKLFNVNDNVTFHSICPQCTQYIGIFDSVTKCVKCNGCGIDVNVSNPSNPCYFAIINPSSAVQDYLQSNEIYYDYITKERVHEKDIISDIYDGKLYRKFVKNISSTDKSAYATVIFNTDGAPVFESSSYSIWPIYLCINEIPAQSRLDSVIVTGLWFGKRKPEMSVFLEVFVNTMNDLSTNGITCIINKEARVIKLFALVACVDTMARNPMNGTCQFNAYFGCDWCTHPGKFDSGSMRYPYLKNPSVSRSTSNTLFFAKEALRTGRASFGVKTASPLLNLQSFDIIKGFTPEYMHCILKGVAAQYTEYLITRLSKNSYNEINYLMTKIRFPHQVGRLTRALNERADYKAREWENWVLYISVPVLSYARISKEHLKHWSLLSQSLYILLKNRITYAELNTVNEMLHTFVRDAEDLYSLKCMTYNTHQLLHMCESIKDWGPLWAHSAFCFESANRELLSAVNSAKGVTQQILRRISLKRAAQILEEIVYPRSSPITRQYYDNLAYSRTKKIFQLSNITYFGKPKLANDTYITKFNVSKETKVFYKIVMNGCLYMSAAKINPRSCNYYAKLINQRYIKIIDFLVDEEKKKEITIYQSLKIQIHKYASTVYEVKEISQELECSKTDEIESICVLVETPTNSYVVPVPNKLFY